MDYNNLLSLQIGEVVQHNNSLFFLSVSAPLRFS
jgi:hypothetical protein